VARHDESSEQLQVHVDDRNQPAAGSTSRRFAVCVDNEGHDQRDSQVIDRICCSSKLLPVPKSSMSFHDFEDFERLVAAAKRSGRSHN